MVGAARATLRWLQQLLGDLLKEKILDQMSTAAVSTALIRQRLRAFQRTLRHVVRRQTPLAQQALFRPQQATAANHDTGIVAGLSYTSRLAAVACTCTSRHV